LVAACNALASAFSRCSGTRTIFPTIPPRVDYELTDLGRGLWQPVEALGQWARDHQVEIEAARTRFDRRNKGK
jgi:DNA-binding HxlR family transcriptional regulator